MLLPVAGKIIRWRWKNGIAYKWEVMRKSPFLIGKHRYTIYKWAIFHGYVSHNQRVNKPYTIDPHLVKAYTNHTRFWDISGSVSLKDLFG